MYPVRASLLRWGVTLAFAIMLCAWFVAPTLAQDLKLGHAVSSGTSSFVSCGPLGPGIDCKADCSGTQCTFFTATIKGTAKADPGGPQTFTGISTVFFGLNGLAVTVNGTANPDGTPGGLCVPSSGSTHVVTPNGTIDLKSTGEVCSVGATADFLGSPTTAFDHSVCISGTGKFAGIQCSGSNTSSSYDGVHFIGFGESAGTK
jgi:hypothetical protein